nr:polyphosphate-glucose phosphotransferase (EC 2.7.1.63) - Propionibacterium freudenreichii subsp. shermanii [Propionibacterium freudenreichii subsp. shermanii]
THVLGID